MSDAGSDAGMSNAGSDAGSGSGAGQPSVASGSASDEEAGSGSARLCVGLRLADGLEQEQAAEDDDKHTTFEELEEEVVRLEGS